MRNIKLTLEYDGKDFFGFQKQKRTRTVQSELEAAFQKLFREKIKLAAAGRTDSGVHAEAQVVSFKTRSKLPVSKIKLGLNYYLPKDLAVTEAKEVSLKFHAQFSARWKTYEYRVWNSSARSPLNRFCTFHVPYALNCSKMKQAAKLLLGKHDFRVFESSRGRRKNAVRTIRKLLIQKKGYGVYFTIESDGFLYKMVRSMAGTLLEVGSGRLSIARFKEILTSPNKELMGAVVPPQGLVLKEVRY